MRCMRAAGHLRSLPGLCRGRAGLRTTAGGLAPLPPMPPSDAAAVHDVRPSGLEVVELHDVTSSTVISAARVPACPDLGAVGSRCSGRYPQAGGAPQRAAGAWLGADGRAHLGHLEHPERCRPSSLGWLPSGGCLRRTGRSHGDAHGRSQHAGGHEPRRGLAASWPPRRGVRTASARNGGVRHVMPWTSRAIWPGMSRIRPSPDGACRATGDDAGTGSRA